ncbi:hypothetical protein Nepgr_033301 [Nepenthes gracilis]|uniref:Uncharacterized protein n=1 Tax=Nepenthes gracilis TaxID=150966 RepID=A0AAD3TKD0_NEPGR|nr:hypothetical protein Nepgr_033301 [Nepenthes gracilis]
MSFPSDSCSFILPFTPPYESFPPLQRVGPVHAPVSGSSNLMASSEGCLPLDASAAISVSAETIISKDASIDKQAALFGVNKKDASVSTVLPDLCPKSMLAGPPSSPITLSNPSCGKEHLDHVSSLNKLHPKRNKLIDMQQGKMGASSLDASSSVIATVGSPPAAVKEGKSTYTVEMSKQSLHTTEAGSSSNAEAADYDGGDTIDQGRQLHGLQQQGQKGSFSKLDKLLRDIGEMKKETAASGAGVTLAFGDVKEEQIHRSSKQRRLRYLLHQSNSDGEKFCHSDAEPPPNFEEGRGQETSQGKIHRRRKASGVGSRSALPEEHCDESVIAKQS